MFYINVQLKLEGGRFNKILTRRHRFSILLFYSHRHNIIFLLVIRNIILLRHIVVVIEFLIKYMYSRLYYIDHDDL